MRKLQGRRRRVVARVLLVLQLFGARAHALNDACNHKHTFFGPSLGAFAAIHQTAAWLAGVKWERSAPRSFGERKVQHSSCDLDCLRDAGRRVTPVVVIAATPAAVELAPARPAPELLAKLPSDLSPVQPSHLHSKN